jgi:hypothetical protein
MVHQHRVVIVVVADAVVLGSLERGHRQKVSTDADAKVTWR